MAKAKLTDAQIDKELTKLRGLGVRPVVLERLRAKARRGLDLGKLVSLILKLLPLLLELFADEDDE